jgi:hypothetical protein
MKKIAILTLMLTFSIVIRGQTILQKTKDLTFAIHQTFQVSNTNKNVKDGTYVASANGKTVAQGNYRDGKRMGYWSFYNREGNLVQSYNYSKDKLIFTDAADTSNIRYFFSETAEEGDTIRNPIKIGGIYYGLMPLVEPSKDFAEQVINDFKNAENLAPVKGTSNRLDCNHIFTLDTNGNIIKHEVWVTKGTNRRLYNITDTNFDDDFKKFIPGSINSKPVECKVIISSQFGYAQVARSGPRRYKVAIRSEF